MTRKCTRFNINLSEPGTKPAGELFFLLLPIENTHTSSSKKMIFPRSITPAIRAVRATSSLTAARPSAVSSVRFYSGPTHSEEAAKADAYKKDHTPEQLQEETVEHHTKTRRADKVTASPNNQPTESEDAAHARHDKDDVETLQKKTANKMQGGS
ncbi:unnamed protein product [Sympodiomycopsis kandeliae]